MSEPNSSDINYTDDERNYDSDESFPVCHSVLECANLSDLEETEAEQNKDIEVEAEQEQNKDAPGPSRPRRSCVINYIEQENRKRAIAKTKAMNRSKGAVPSKRRKTGDGVRTVKITVEEIWAQSLKLALPQFHYPVVAPDRTAYKYWKETNSLLHNKMLPKHERVNYEEAIEKFRSLRCGTEIPHASTLIVGDSILSACNFEEKLDSTVSIMITFPNKAIDFANAFINKIIDDADDFTFDTIVIAFGIEFVCYDPDPKEAVNATREFVIKLLRAFHDHFMSKPNVRFILLTIPHVNNDRNTISFVPDIDYYNRYIRKFFNKYHEEIKEKWSIDLCLFDWEKEAHMYKEFNAEHVQKRYQVLLNEVRKYTSITD